MKLGPLLYFLVHTISEFLSIEMLSLFRMSPSSLAIILTSYDINWVSHTADDLLGILTLIIREGQRIMALTNPNPFICDFFP